MPTPPRGAARLLPPLLLLAAACLPAARGAACVPQQYPKQGALLPVAVPGRVLDLAWAPETANASAVFMLTTDGYGFPGGPLWRSDYHGRADSWRDATPALAAALPPGLSPPAGAADTGVLAVLQHADRPGRVLLQGAGRFHFASDDGGATLRALGTPGGTPGAGQELRPHPRRADWLLAKARRAECAADVRSRACAADLWVSQDWGASWRNLTQASGGRVAAFRDFDWGAALPALLGRPPPDEAILATAYLSASKQKGLYPGWDEDLQFVVSLDLFASAPARVVPCGNLFEVVANKVFLAVPSTCPLGPDGRARRRRGGAAMPGRSITLYVSPDGDGFVEACLPVGLEDDGYNVVHTHDGWGAFVLADHAEPGSSGPSADAPASDAYAPAYNASLHTLALRGVYRRDYVVDFARVEGVPGAYLANQVGAAAAGGGPRPGGGRPGGSRAAADLRLQSRLTTNGGASWAPLAPPAEFRFGTCSGCAPGAAPGSPGCSLHLHGPTSWYAPEGAHPSVYTAGSAPGLVMASGTAGAALDFSPDADCTWLSRDGGRTWRDVAPHTAIYEYGGSGSLIAMAPHRSEGPADAVSLSLDGGDCWHRVVLPEAVLVDNIRAAPGGAGALFLVHGTACARSAARPSCGFAGGGEPPSRLYAIDVRELMGSDVRACDAAPGSADFADGAPLVAGPDGGAACLLGAARTARRRRDDAACLLPDDYAHPAPAAAPCACGEADLECEFGYARAPPGADGAPGGCERVPGLDAAAACPRLQNGGYLASSTAKRLVHADACEGVGKVIPDTDGRGGAGGKKRRGGGGSAGGGGGGGVFRSLFLFLLCGGAVAAAAALAWAHCLSPGARDAAAAAAAPALAAAGAAGGAALDALIAAHDWVRAKLRGAGFNPYAASAGGVGAGAYEPLGDDLHEDDLDAPARL